jgi:hypothetical protein
VTAARGADEVGRKQAQEYATRLRTNSKIARQVVLLAALYARTDQETLNKVRKALQPWTWLADVVPNQLSAPSALFVVGGFTCGAVLVAAGIQALTGPIQGHSKGSSFGVSAWKALTEKPVHLGSGAAGVAVVSAGAVMRLRHTKSLARAVRLQANVRVVKRRPVDDVASVLDLFVKGNDDVDTIRYASGTPSALQVVIRCGEVLVLRV